MAKRPIPFLFGAFFLAGLFLSLSCNLPISLRSGKDLSQDEALQLVLDEIVKPDQLGEDPLIVFAWPELLLPGDQIGPYNQPGSESIRNPVEVAEESWFFWIDDAPAALFAHPSRFVLITKESGQITVSDEEWWPVLNGTGLWTSSKEYWNESNWAFSNLESSPAESGSTVNKNLLSVISRVHLQSDKKGTAIIINTYVDGQPNGEDFEVASNGVHDMLEASDFNVTYLGPEKSENKNQDDELTRETRSEFFREAHQELEPGDTLVVYLTGHGGYDTEDGTVGGQLESDLRDRLIGVHPGVHTVVIIDACFSGQFIDSINKVADIVITSTNYNTLAWTVRVGETYQKAVKDPNVVKDPNPEEKGLEFSAGYILGWLEVINDDTKKDEARRRAASSGTGYWEEVAAMAYVTALKYDFLYLNGGTFPLAVRGVAETRPIFTATPTNTPTPTPTPTKTPSPYGRYVGDFRVSLDMITDNGGHQGFITISVKDGPFRIEGPVPWMTVSGELNPDESITATGYGTVDGYPGIKVTFKGYITPYAIEGEYILGVDGGLQGGQPVVYRISGERKEKATPTPTNTPTPDPGDSEQACLIFDEIDFVDTIMRHMRDCNPTLNFYYKMDTTVPGLTAESPMDLDYWVTVNGKQGDCFLETGFDDRLYCRVDISAGEANTLGHFVLFANPCQEPIYVLDITIPVLEGCGESHTEPEEPPCDSED